MNIRLFALPFIVLLPLSANTWEAGVFVGSQSYRSETGISSSSSSDNKVDSKLAYGFRLGRSLVDLGPALLEVTVGYQPPVTSTYTLTVDSFAPTQNPARSLAGPKTFTTTSGSFDYKASNFSVGAMFNFKAFVAIGAGVEYRFEKLETPGESTTYGRPWARVNAGIAIPSPIVKPFIGVEVAVPFTSTSLADASSSEDLLKVVAPKMQVGVYAGIRF